MCSAQCSGTAPRDDLVSKPATLSPSCAPSALCLCHRSPHERGHQCQTRQSVALRLPFWDQQLINGPASGMPPGPPGHQSPPAHPSSPGAGQPCALRWGTGPELQAPLTINFQELRSSVPNLLCDVTTAPHRAPDSVVNIYKAWPTGALGAAGPAGGCGGCGSWSSRTRTPSGAEHPQPHHPPPPQAATPGNRVGIGEDRPACCPRLQPQGGGWSPLGLGGSW